MELETLLVELPASGNIEIVFVPEQCFWCGNDNKILVFLSYFSLARQIKWYDGIPYILATWNFICLAAVNFVLLTWQ